MPYHPIKKKIVRRLQDPVSATDFSSLPPLLQRIYALRRVADPRELDRSLNRLPDPWLLSGLEAMVERLADAILRNRSLLVIGDYDADGATASAVAVRGLRALGLKGISYLVPNRFEYGYGLTPEIAALAAQRRPDLLLTVDNGISSLAGVAAAKALGMDVLVTDHHLPGRELPEADAIVDPNLPGDAFPGKALAGVGVMFYVLMALRQRLRGRTDALPSSASLGWRAGPSVGEGRPAEPNLGRLLDLVALGTVADVVPLDHVNRVLVHQGLQRIRAEQCHPGLLALMEAAGRKPKQMTAADLGFFLGPRLNAAGRLEDMSLGIECLLSDGPEAARRLAARLDELNRDRREIEDQMKLDALALLERLDASTTLGVGGKPALALFEEDWHQGVVGLVATRIKDRINRPVIAFAPAGPGSPELKGSARSIPGVHIRDVLAGIAARRPDLLKKFGGHAMAAGISLVRENLEEFAVVFEREVQAHLVNLDLENAVHTDGALDPREFDLDLAELLRQSGPWGQGFPEPLFDGEFEVAGSRIVGERHLRLSLKPRNKDLFLDAIAFGVEAPEDWLGCREVRAAYRLDVNEFRDQRKLQLRIEYMETGET